MAQSSIFQWRQGAGWLVLSSGNFQNNETEAIDSRMLNRSDADGPLVYIDAAHEAAVSEHYLQYLNDLGGRSGYAIDIIVEDDATLQKQIGEAGIIVIGHGPDGARLYNGLQGVTSKAIAAAYANGALIMGCGIGADVFGQWLISETTGEIKPGFGWLTNAVVLGTHPDPQQKGALQQLLYEQPTAFGLGIQPGAALALGPTHQVELWGNQQIAISLGRGYSVQE
ncbi:Type 1 glutamine amidotransferase-like domain-containing protein [Chloroflexota bacterium]